MADDRIQALRAENQRLMQAKAEVQVAQRAIKLQRVELRKQINKDNAGEVQVLIEKLNAESVAAMSKKDEIRRRQRELKVELGGLVSVQPHTPGPGAALVTPGVIRAGAR